MSDHGWRSGAYAAEFADEATFVAAIKRLRQEGYGRVEAYSPYPVPSAEQELSERPSALPWIVFVAGLAGGVSGYLIQWYANAVSYPLNIGGRPAHATPAFFIPSFEGLVLAASLAAFVGLFALLRLPKPWHPMFEVDGFERASLDRFWIAVDADDAQVLLQRSPPSFDGLNAVRIVRVPAEPA
ncbi:MAG TPA: DUF3341 domain-containing protein [Gemmatimonadaceae bacterium]|nr:DUF3341 domain-containing protein [Gemmatimonadaceae bacterium]